MKRGGVCLGFCVVFRLSFCLSPRGAMRRRFAGSWLFSCGRQEADSAALWNNPRDYRLRISSSERKTLP